MKTSIHLNYSASDFTQQDSRQRRTTNYLYVTTVTAIEAVRCLNCLPLVAVKKLRKNAENFYVKVMLVTQANFAVVFPLPPGPSCIEHLKISGNFP